MNKFNAALMLSLLALEVHAQDVGLYNDGGHFRITTNTYVKVPGNFTNQSGGNFQNDGILSIGGDITNNQLMTSGGFGILALNGSAAQSVGGSSPFWGGLIVASNTVGITLNNMLNVQGGLVFAASGTLTTNGNLTLKSTSPTASAVVGPVMGSITGNVIHERYLSAPANGSGGRSWRLLTTPLKGSTNNSVYYNWQNNGANNGTGIEIWGPGGGNGLASGPAASLRTFNPVTNQYVAVNNTQTTPLFDANRNNAFLAFVSGAYGSGNVYSGAAATNAIATGELITGTQTYSFTPPNASNIYYLIGNPYACPVDFDEVYQNTNTANINRMFWVVDPNLGSIGAYATVTYTGGVYVTSAGNQNQYLQNGQAFFVEGNNVGNASTVEIEENDKQIFAPQAAVFRTNGSNLETFRVKLFKTINSARTQMDGCVVAAHESSNNAVDQVDGKKFGNFNENLSIMKGATSLAVEARQLLDNNDTVNLAIGNMQQTTYELEFEPGNMNVAGLTATLIDNFTNTSTPVNLNGNTVYSFSVTGNSASTGNGRFKVVFGNNTPLELKFVALNAKKEENKVNIDWTITNQEGIKTYEVERSNDGKSFSKIGSLTADEKTDYLFTDENPGEASNYYRVKAIARSTHGVYSNIVRVNMNSDIPAIATYPNPVKGDNLQVNINNLEKGVYSIGLFNVSGQKVVSKEVSIQGGSTVISLDVKQLAQGIYIAQLVNERGEQMAEQKIVRQ